MATHVQLASSAFAGCLAGFVICKLLQRRRSSSAQLKDQGDVTGMLPLLVPEAQLHPQDFDAPCADLRLLRKAEAILARRCGAVLLVLERLQDGHNYSAVLRTMEALGVQNIWVVSSPGLESKNCIKRQSAAILAETAKDGRVKKRAIARRDAIWEADVKEDEIHTAFAKKAQKWLTVREFDSTASCVEALRNDGRHVWVTALEQTADVLAPGAAWLEENFPDALPERLALVMGAEEAGVSQHFKDAADRLVYLPLGGFAESLNVSVAAALIVQLLLQLYARAAPQRQLALSFDEQKVLRADWYAKLARTDEEHELYKALLEHPPSAFHDVRRPEAHRIARVGRHWKDPEKS